MHINQSASLDFNTAATQTVVAAVTGKRIAVTGYTVVNGVATAQTIQFKSGSNALTGVMSLPSSIGGGQVANAGDERFVLFITDVSAALTMVMSAATQVGGHVQYKLI